MCVSTCPPAVPSLSSFALTPMLCLYSLSFRPLNSFCSCSRIPDATLKARVVPRDACALDFVQMCLPRTLLRHLRDELVARLTRRISEGKLSNSRKVRLDPTPDDILKLVLMRLAACREMASTRSELYRDPVPLS